MSRDISNTIVEQKEQKKRIEYLDAMRGFTMLLVVFSHVITNCLRSTPSFSFNDVFISFRMPLFFFLSGFLMYKKGFFKSIEDVLSFLKKKFKVQIIPTFIFIAVYALLFKESFISIWFHCYKKGYWFTFVLFFYFLFYSTSSYILGSFFKLKRPYNYMGMLIIVLFIYFIAVFSMHPLCPWKSNSIIDLFSVIQFRYYIFFCFGALIKANFKVFEELLDKQIIITFALLLFFIFQVLVQDINGISGILGMIRGSIIRPILGFLGIIIVFAFFRTYKHTFTKASIWGRFLQYIGVRTLDIYLLHYLVLPLNLNLIGCFFTNNFNPLIEFIIGLFIALCVLVVCLAISQIVRLSDFLAQTLFGKIIPVAK